MNVPFIKVDPVEQIAAHPETINRLGLDQFERVDGLLIIRWGIAFGTPLVEDPDLPTGEIHARPRTDAQLVRRPMTISKSRRKEQPDA